MKVAILAGGRGSRLSEETNSRPKPMVEIGGRPLLWHIMMHYHMYGFQDFTVALGYKGDVIKRWFDDHTLTDGGLQVDTETRLNWTVHLADTGIDTETGGRVKALEKVLGRERCLLTWGDGVSDVDLNALIAFHKSHGKLCTMTAVRPPPRFGHLTLDGDQVTAFDEKPDAAEGWINGAFFVLEPEVFDRIEGPATSFERSTLTQLAEDGELMAYKHHGFWQCMDTLNDKRRLEDHWATGHAPWAMWDKH